MAIVASEPRSEIGDVVSLYVVKSLLGRIERRDPALVDRALTECTAKIRRDGWRVDAAAYYPPAPSFLGRLSALTGFDKDAIEAVYQQSKVNLVIECLQEFAREHCGGQR